MRIRIRNSHLLLAATIIAVMNAILLTMLVTINLHSNSSAPMPLDTEFAAAQEVERHSLTDAQAAHEPSQSSISATDEAAAQTTDIAHELSELKRQLSTVQQAVAYLRGRSDGSDPTLLRQLQADISVIKAAVLHLRQDQSRMNPPTRTGDMNSPTNPEP